MSVNLENLLQKSKHYETWIAIAENRLTDAQRVISAGQTEKKSGFWSSWKRKVSASPVDPVLKAAYMLLSDSPVEGVIRPASGLKTAGDDFPEWVRFCWVLQENGHFEQHLDKLLSETLVWLEQLADEVHRKANGYPSKPTTGEVWFNGAIIRNWSESLAALFDHRQKGVDTAKTLQLKCQVTSSIMSHYPNILGPDMIEAAAAWEAVGETAISRQYYQAIITDFQPMAEDIRSIAAEGVTEDDIQTLQALRDAYDGWNRVQQIYAYAAERSWVEALLQRGVKKSL